MKEKELIERSLELWRAVEDKPELLQDAPITQAYDNPAYPYLDAALHRLSRAMPKDFNFPWAEKRHPDRYRHYRVKEKAQEEAYFEVDQGIGSLDSFKAALDAWEKAALPLFELYKTRPGGEIEVRHE